MNSPYDQVGDRDHRDPVPLAVRDQVRHAGHRPVVVHDLADDARRKQAGEPREVDRCLRLTGAVEHTAVACPKREDVARRNEVFPSAARVDRHLDRPRAVGRRDAGGDALARLDRDRERGAEGRLVPFRHRPETELVAPLLGQA
jgi:hypothetical protein